VVAQRLLLDLRPLAQQQICGTLDSSLALPPFSGFHFLSSSSGPSAVAPTLSIAAIWLLACCRRSSASDCWRVSASGLCASGCSAVHDQLKSSRGPAAACMLLSRSWPKLARLLSEA